MSKNLFLYLKSILGAGIEKTRLEEEILDYALKKENYGSFAQLLKKILPAYTDWSWGQDGIYRSYFNEWQRSGFNLMPNHFYSPIPDIGQLEAVYSKKSEMIGIDLREDAQLSFLESVCPIFEDEYSRFPDRKTDIGYEFHFNNGTFDRVDAEILHCMIRHIKPKRLVEIGSGFSSLISAAACHMNKQKDGMNCEFTAIEPFPNPLFKKNIPGLSRLIKKPLQDVGMDFFTELQENDILFIDSSHVLKIGSDVQIEYLEILPRLNKGVIVHIHDIFLPLEYPKHWIKGEHIFWNEQYLLQAFLSFNDSFEILWAGCYMSIKHSDRLAKHFPGYSPERHLPGSFWMRRKV